MAGLKRATSIRMWESIIATALKPASLAMSGLISAAPRVTTTRLVPVEAPPAPAPTPGVPPLLRWSVPPPPMVVTETELVRRPRPQPSVSGHPGVRNTHDTLEYQRWPVFQSFIHSGAEFLRYQEPDLYGDEQFPRGYYASLDYSLENSSYTSSAGVEDSSPGRLGTPEDYPDLGSPLAARCSCGRMFAEHERLLPAQRGQWRGCAERIRAKRCRDSAWFEVSKACAAARSAAGRF